MAGSVPFGPQGYRVLLLLPASFASVRRFLLTLFLLAAFVVLGAGAAGLWWVHQPLKLPAPTVDLSVEPGTTPRGVAQAVADAGVDVPPQLLYWWFRFSGQDRQIRAGSYELERGITPRLLLNMLVRGEEATRSVVLVEGWNFRQVRAALAKAEQLKPETVGLTDEELMARLGKPGAASRGPLLPRHLHLFEGLHRPRRCCSGRCGPWTRSWKRPGPRAPPDLPLKTADEALILASIVEKETGKAKDRAEIAAVFVNRLRAGMPLQTDPTVIYGMGTRFDGNLRKKDLQADTPWNTYTARRPAAHADRHAGQGRAAGGGAAGAEQVAVLRLARRRHQPFQQFARRAQPRGEPLPARHRAPHRERAAMTQQQGLFITLEGIDGAGKSSHIDALEALFKAQGRAVTRTREPGGTPLAETLRTLILTQADGPADRVAAGVRGAARPHRAGDRAGAGARRGGAVRPLHRCHLRLPGRRARLRPGGALDPGAVGAGGRDGALLQPDAHAVVRPAARDRGRAPGRRAAAGQVRIAAGRVLPPRGRGLCRSAPAAAPRFVRIDADQPREQVWAQVEAALVAARAGRRHAMSAPALSPWLRKPLAELLRQRGHAWLLQGPSGLGQYELGLALARRLAVRAARRNGGQGACGHCPSCHAIDVRTHADLCVLMPEVAMQELGWPLDEKSQADIDDKKRKPSREIRVEAMRDAVGFAQRTSGRGRGKAVLVYPAERMNTITANALLKTLEEPVGDVRFVLASEAAWQLLPTIRSRCLGFTMPWPGDDEAREWLVGQGVPAADAAALLRAAGGRPQRCAAAGRRGPVAQGLEPAAEGHAARRGRRAGRPCAGRRPSARCRSCATTSWPCDSGAAPRFFEAADLPAVPPRAALAPLGASRSRNAAKTAEHPFNAGLMLEALVSEARSTLNSASRRP